MREVAVNKNRDVGWQVEDGFPMCLWRNEVFALILPWFDDDEEREGVWMREQRIRNSGATTDGVIADGFGEGALRHFEETGEDG